MGWLRDSMRHGQHRSFGAVARAALAHPGWPADSRPQPRSLAALLSKLDRGIELEWLADRPRVQEILAELLGTPRSRIAESVGAAVAATDEKRRRVRFEDVPYASPLDLASEALPPGLPDAVLHPATWGSVWWFAPSGSGRSLVGAWLEARALATHVTARNGSVPALDQPRARPLFVELHGEVGERAPVIPSEGLCVAAPFLPDPSSAAGWKVVESPPPASWMPDLVHWLALRLPRDGHFVPDRALEWLENAASIGHVDNLGSALGLAGLIDQYGLREIEQRGLAAMAGRFVQDRLASASAADPGDTRWLAGNGSEVVGRLARRLLTDSAVPWDAPRTLEEWVRLVPPEYQDTVDSEWVRLSLSRAASPPTVKELERALRDLPPGAFRLVRALERAGLLRRTEDGDALVLAPRWLARRAIEEARALLVQGEPSEWGEALLEPRGAAEMMRAIARRAASGDPSLFEEVLDAENPRSPGVVAATEAAFRAAGLALLAGVEIPDDVVLALWDQQIALLVERDDGPHPRIDHDARAVAEEPMLGVGIFRLAALAVSEALPAERGRRHPGLRPWVDPGAGDAALPALDAIWQLASGVDLTETTWALDAFSLADRLRAARTEARALRARAAPGGGGALEATALHPLEWPGAVLDAIERRTLEWKTVRAAEPALIAALFALGGLRGLPPEVVSAALWFAWARDPCPIDPASPLSPSSRHAPILFSSIPASVLTVMFARAFVDPRALPYDLLDEAGFRAIAAANPAALRGVRAAWRVMPPGVAAEILAASPPGPEDLAELWARAPAVVLAAFDAAITARQPAAMDLVRGAPGPSVRAVVERLRPGVRGSSPLATEDGRRAVRAWLHDKVRSRTEGFRQAFDLLLEMG
jgi:hypothetical protein